MRIFLSIFFLLVSFNSHSQELSTEYQSNQSDLHKAEELARDTASWFQYTTGPMTSEHLGQCGDYAVMFILKYNQYSGANLARLVDLFCYIAQQVPFTTWIRRIIIFIIA